MSAPLSRAAGAPLRRIGWTAALIGLVLAGGAGLLVVRSLMAAQSERRLRHLVLAERVFDEMERDLSALLIREESRSFLQYRHTYVPEGSLPGNPGLTRSPLADLPDDPAVLGYFQIEPDGQVSTPLLDDAGSAWGETDLTDARVQRAAQILPLVQTWAEALRSAAPQRPTADPLADGVDNQPGTWDQGYASSLARLNRGVRERQDRDYVTKKASNDNISQFQQKNPTPKDPDPELVNPPSKGEDARQLSPREGPRGLPNLPPEVDVTLGPFNTVDTPEWILLVRTVRVVDESYVQGLILDRAALQRSLQTAELSQGELAGLTELRWGTVQLSEAAAFSFPHSFAAPFSSMTATLDMEAMPERGLDARTTIAVLAVLLAGTAGIGAFAVARMVTVTVTFSERRNNFVAAVSHELKTPLTAIRLYAEMLRDDLVPDDARRHSYYETILAETERLSRLIQNVLDLSRLSRGKYKPHLEIGPCGPVLEEVLRVVGPHAASEGFALSLELEPDLPSVRYERDALLQVLLNLVDNAIKFSREHTERRVVLRASREGQGVALTVRDHGPGVPARHLSHLFQPFYRGEEELRRRTQGTGIGLALVAGLTRGMGGRVRARNHPDGGFEVSVVLPVAAAL